VLEDPPFEDVKHCDERKIAVIKSSLAILNVENEMNVNV
jgi:hypothetical protein